jgi:hypothetical protein
MPRPARASAPASVLVVGALAGATIANGPVYVRRDCYFVRRYNRWGEPRLIKVCDY